MYYHFLGTVATRYPGKFYFFIFLFKPRVVNVDIMSRDGCIETLRRQLNVVALAVRRRDESGRRKARRERLERGGGCGETIGGGWTT